MAEYSSDGTTWKKLEIGMVLKQGSAVKTDKAAVVDLFLKQNGPVVRVTPDTTLKLDKLTFDQADAETVINTELNLSNGRILGNVKKLAAASKYDVKTAKATCGIRGTQFDIASNGKVTVVEGSVTLTFTPTGGAAPVTVTVTAGQTLDPTTAKGQSDVRAATVQETKDTKQNVAQSQNNAAPSVSEQQNQQTSNTENKGGGDSGKQDTTGGGKDKEETEDAIAKATGTDKEEAKQVVKLAAIAAAEGVNVTVNLDKVVKTAKDATDKGVDLKDVAKVVQSALKSAGSTSDSLNKGLSIAAAVTQVAGSAEDKEKALQSVANAIAQSANVDADSAKKALNTTLQLASSATSLSDVKQTADAIDKTAKTMADAVKSGTVSAAEAKNQLTQLNTTVQNAESVADAAKNAQNIADTTKTATTSGGGAQTVSAVLGAINKVRSAITDNLSGDKQVAALSSATDLINRSVAAVGDKSDIITSIIGTALEDILKVSGASDTAKSDALNRALGGIAIAINSAAKDSQGKVIDRTALANLIKDALTAADAAATPANAAQLAQKVGDAISPIVGVVP